MKKSLIIFLFIPLNLILNAQTVSENRLPDRLRDHIWTASWISSPLEDNDYPVISFFRNSFTLDSLPTSLLLHISAAQTCIFHVNGHWIGTGPDKGMLQNRYFDTYELAPFLQKGENILACEVLGDQNEGKSGDRMLEPMLLVQADAIDFDFLNTPGTWKSFSDTGIRLSDSETDSSAFHQVVDGKKIPSGWELPGYNSVQWSNPLTGPAGALKGQTGVLANALVPSFRTATIQKSPLLPVLKGENQLPTGQRSGKPLTDLILGPDKEYTLVLDAGEMQTGLPEIRFSGGTGSRIELSLTKDIANLKSDNNTGNQDGLLILPDGGKHIRATFYDPPAYRYIKVHIRTGTEAVNIESIRILPPYTPEIRASMKVNQSLISSDWDASLLYFGLHSHDLTEGLKPFDLVSGEGRAAALSSYYLCGEGTQAKQLIFNLYQSIIPEGLLSFYADGYEASVQPLASMEWISLLYDYLWHSQDEQFVFDMLIPVQNILSWFEYRIDQESGMLGPLGYAPVLDEVGIWTDPYDNISIGVPPGARTGDAASLTLRFSLALTEAAGLFSYFGYADIADSYTRLAASLNKAAYTSCWDEEKGFMADTPEKSTFSQHTQIMSILSGAVPDDRQALLMDRTLSDPVLTKASAGYSLYLTKAMLSAGTGNKLTEYILNSLPAKSDQFRGFSYLNGVAGIRPGDIGFRKAIIAPNPGQLNEIDATVPCEAGSIREDLQFSRNGSVKGYVYLPEGVEGIFIWYGQTRDLKAGKQFISIQNKFL